jgi:transcriptional regulator with XRE-family HTH domain
VDERFFMNSSGVDAATRFGRELRCRRTQAGMTQRQLADQLRYSREMVAAVERGRRFGSQSLAVRADEVLGTDGVLSRMWPLVETEQVAADRRRGPRPERGAPVRRIRRTPADWADWAAQIRPAMDQAPPELVDQLRDLINTLTR